jgi:hypothetical protein
MNYRGTRGKPVKTLEHLQELAENRKSVAMYSKFDRVMTVQPAKTILFRQCTDVIRILGSNRMFEYIKPTPLPKTPKFLTTKRKPGKKEGIRRILTTMKEFEGHSTDAYGLLHILEGLDPAMANRIRDDKENWYPDLEKAKAELKKLEEA